MSAAEKQLHPDENYQLGDAGGTLFKAGLGIGVVGLGITVAAGLAKGDSMTRFFYSYLFASTYFLSISLGALFFVLVNHLFKSKWNITTRRIGELLTMPFGLLALVIIGGIAIPMLAGNDSLYLWSKHEADYPEHLRHLYAHVHHKSAYLNVPAFLIRLVLYFGVWWGLSRFFFKRSVAQDTDGDVKHTERMAWMGGPSAVLFAFTICFASFDLLMSLSPTWYSTMFGVYYFAGAGIAGYSMIILVAMAFQGTGRLTHSITVEHYHDLGKMLFVFVFFWGYTQFCQFMLIWYADIPEETVWFRHRLFTSWKYVCMVLLVLHLAFPMVCLLSRWTKRKRHLLRFFAVWMMILHAVDIFFVVVPEYDKTGININIMDVTAFVGIGGLFLAVVMYYARKVNLLPIKDPKLGKSLAFHNL